jgi:hypothetical protein
MVAFPFARSKAFVDVNSTRGNPVCEAMFPNPFVVFVWLCRNTSLSALVAHDVSGP